MSRQVAEAQRTDGQYKKDDGFSRTIIYRDALKETRGVDPVAFRKDQGMEVEVENPSYILMKETTDQRNKRVKEESERYQMNGGGSAKVAEKEGLIYNEVQIGRGAIPD